MALTTYPITGDLKDAHGGDAIIGKVTLTPYGSHDARVDGANALLGAISYDLYTTEAEGGLPATLDLTAGAWIITIRAKSRAQGEQQFKTIQHVIDHQAATTWGAIVSGAVSSPPMTPTLVQQAQDAATAAEASATTASADAAAADQARADAEAAAATATAPTDSMVASLAADPASATGAELRETFVRRDRLRQDVAPISAMQGVVCFTWDDGRADCVTVAAIHEARGQRFTLAISKNLIGLASYLTATELQTIADAGHELASHSVAHTTDMTTLTPAQRAADHDEMRTYLEGITGRPPTSMVWPVGNRNDTTDRECYLRYDRSIGAAGIALPIDRRDCPRLIFRHQVDDTAASQDRARALIDMCAQGPYAVSLMFHRLDVSGNPTTAEYVALADYALTTGVPAVNLEEAYRPRQMVADAGFEDSAVGDGSWLAVKSGAAAVAEIIPDTPAAGMPGTQSLHLSADIGGYSYVYQMVQVVPGRTYKVSGRYRSSGTLGSAGDLQFRVRPVQVDGTFISNIGLNLAASAAWARGEGTFTVPANARYAYIDMKVQPSGVATTIEAWFDHLDVALEENRSYG